MPDSQGDFQQPEPIEECFYNECSAPIYPGQTVFKVAEDICCSASCAQQVLKEIKIERFTI